MSNAAEMLDDNLLAAYIICHNNWKFDFLRPQEHQIIDMYLKMHGSNHPQEEVEHDDEAVAQLLDAEPDEDGTCTGD